MKGRQETMMSKQTSWDDIGRTMATQTSLFTIARDSLKGTGIGPEIVPWLCGAGRAELIDAIHVLASNFVRERVVRASESANLVLVNAAWRADSVGHQKQDWIEVCKKGKTVYIGGRRVGLKQSSSQLAEGGPKTGGREAMRALNKAFEPVDPIFIEAFKAYPWLVPEGWKVDGSRFVKHIFFWAKLGRDHRGEYADGFYWSEGAVVESRHHLMFVWDYLHHSAMYER